jgi:AraC family transcriptional regulator
LAQFCVVEPDEERVRNAVRSFLQGAGSEIPQEAPSWIQLINQRLRSDATLGVLDLANDVGRHPSWLGTAYRRATGERLMQTAARLRVERAARLLRETDHSCAHIAHEAGFCDQSHMNRTFRRLLRRSPSDARNDRAEFRQIPMRV